MLLFITAVSVVLIVSFLCSIFESVLLSLTRPQVVSIEQDKPRVGALLSKFKDNMDVPIAAILILNTAAHTIGAAVAGASYSNVFDPGTLWIFSIVFTLAVLLFTEIIPKTVGVGYATSLAGPVAYGIHWLSILLRPLVMVSEVLSRSLRRDVPVPVTSPDELRLLAILGRNEGAVGERTAGMIVGATQIRHLRARDVMLPREGVQFLSATMTRDEVVRLMRQTGHSRFPFSPTDHLSDASGVVLAKNLLHWLLQNDGETIDWDALRQDALIVHDTARLPRLLHSFQESQRHLAIVVDEYGTVEGIVTMEDVLEEIVGDIRDESDLPDDELREQSDGSLLVRADLDLRKLSDKLGVTWDPDSSVSTVGGLIMETLESVPVVGDTIDWQGHKIEVLRADRRRARMLRISR